MLNGVIEFVKPFIVNELHTGAAPLVASPVMNKPAIKHVNTRPIKYTNPFNSLLKIELNVKKQTKIKGDNLKNKYNNEFKFNSM